MALILHPLSGPPGICARLLVLSLMCLAPWGARAQSPALKLSRAVALSVGGAPDIDAATAGVDAAKAASAGAALKTPWETTFTLENFAGGGTASGLDSAEATIEVGRTLESHEKREQRMHAAQAAVGSADVEVTVVRAERIKSVFARYVDAWASQERANVLSEIANMAQEGVAVAQRRVQSGRSSEAELASARSVAARAELEAQLESARYEAQLSGLRLLLDGAVESSIDTLVWDGSVRELEPLLPRTAAVVEKAEAERLQAEAELSYARTQGAADWQVAAGVRRLEELDTEALVFSVSRPWGTARRAQPAIDQATANLRRVSALAQVLTRDVGLQRESLRADAAARRMELSALEQTVIPQAVRARDVYRRGYALGRFSLVELSVAERDLLDARTRAVDARAGLASAELGYRMLTGRWLEDTDHD